MRPIPPDRALWRRQMSRSPRIPCPAEASSRYRSPRCRSAIQSAVVVHELKHEKVLCWRGAPLHQLMSSMKSGSLSSFSGDPKPANGAACRVHRRAALSRALPRRRCKSSSYLRFCRFGHAALDLVMPAASLLFLISVSASRASYSCRPAPRAPVPGSRCAASPAQAYRRRCRCRCCCRPRAR